MATTTPPVTVVSSGASATIKTVTMASTSRGLAAASGKHDVVLLSPVIPRDTVRGVIGLATVPHQQP